MATESTEAPGEFGRVSRLRGTAFRYLAMGASWLGIVVLAALLVRVVIDAFGLVAAGAGWFLAYLAALVLPAAAIGAYGLRNRAVGIVAVRSVAVPAAGLFLGAGIVILFVVFNPQVWLVYYTASILPAGAAYGYGRYRGDGRAPFAAALVGLAGVALGALVWNAVDVYPLDWIIHLWTLAAPAAAAFGYAAWRRSDRRRGAAAGIAVLAGAVLAAQAAFALPIGPAHAVILFLTVALPTGAYVGRVVTTRDEGWPGIFAPVVLIAGAVLGRVLVEALGAKRPDVWLDWQFLTSAWSSIPEQAGLYPAIIGSVFIIAIVAVVSFVLGVGAAIYLEEYAPESGAPGAVTRVIRINIANLAGVPSVVYGLLGLGLFVNLLGMGLGTVLVAALTLSLLILPITIISAQEAVRSVPNSLREASFGMGATRWQTIRNVVLPHAIPGILTGTILSLSRALGETAPLLMIGAASAVFTPPQGFTSQVSAMPLQVFYWSFAAKSAFREDVAPAGVVTLLVVLLAMNSVAIYLRNRYQRTS